MIKLNIKHTKAETSCLETLVEGNVNSIFVEFTFSSEWSNLSRIVVFKNGTAKVSVSLSGSSCAIPWEVLASPGELIVAVRGVGSNGSTVLCTENVSLGKVNESLADGNGDTPDEATAGVIDSLVSDVAELKASAVTAPVRGVDYWTSADIAAIDTYIDTRLGVVENGSY